MIRKIHNEFLVDTLLFFPCKISCKISLHFFQDFPKVCPKTAEICTKICNDKNRCHTDEHFNEEYDFLYVDNLALSLANNTKWYKVDGKKEIFEIFDMIDDPQSYQLVAGNTAHGKNLTAEFSLINVALVAEV